ncbi:flavin-containing monooxygenase [Gordonia phosphorivorans]|uniref:Flavin-containing monooxygenase 5 n=1 Tax=Gordonia phosphorivorans TaxID=1056982 RepID=A0ABV6HDT4_9ACTN
MTHSTNSAEPTFDAQACVVGAGPSGLAAGKALADRGIDFDWFEKGSMVGGLWRIDNDNGSSPAYKSLHLNSSRPLTEYPSHPMPEQWPDFPHHTLVAEYFQGFAEEHGLLDRITFGTEVTKIDPLPGDGPMGGNGWAVTTGDGVTRTYRYVLLGPGHHSIPQIPEFAGDFSGETMHAHEYHEQSVFEGKDVLVIGVGNSGMDIACEAIKTANSVHVSTRSGVHVLPKYAFGKPIDQLGSPLMAYVPFPVERALYGLTARLAAGRPEDRGLPKPNHKILHAHPTVSAEFYDRVGHGDIAVHPDIEKFDDDEVVFVDGVRQHVDIVVFATGYKVSLPFFDKDVYDPAANAMPLYQRVLTPDRPGLFFIGFIQAVGSGIPFMEMQSEWVGDLITGASVLPSEAEQRQWIADDQAALAARYVRSERHTMQVDYWRYRRALLEVRAYRPNPSLRERLTRPLLGLR